MSLERCIRLIVSAALLVVLALEAPARSEAPRGKKYALLVGVTEYQRDTFTTLKYTENDVERLARLLNRPGSGFAQVRVLTVSRGKKNSKDAPDARNALAVLKTVVNRTEGDTLVISAAVPVSTLAALVKKQMTKPPMTTARHRMTRRRLRRRTH